MTLQRRLALTLLGTTLPILFAGLWLRAEFFRRAGEQALVEIVDSRLELIGQQRCEEDPASLSRRGWPGHRDGRGAPRDVRAEDGPGPERPGPPPRGFPDGRRPRPGEGPGRPQPRLFAYDSGYRSALHWAPPFPPELRQRLETNGSPAVHDSEAPDRARHLQVAVRTGWDGGGCAIVLGQLEMPPTPRALRALLVPALVLSGALLVSVWLAAGPVVRRIRRLTAAVQRSAADRYASEVPEGGGDEISELSRAFNAAGRSIREHVERLERRDETLRAFLANTTHDVMLPLTVLQGHLDSLHKRAQSETPAAPEEVTAAMEEAQYMASLLHNLSAVAKLEGDAALLEREPVDLGALVDRVAARHRTLASSRGLGLEHATPEERLEVLGDVTLLEQAVGNVVHNAVRYNRRGGHVAVVLERRHRGNGATFELRVLDDGPGVPEDQLSRLTERRFRGDEARTRRPEGLGLGLHIARDVAERHGFTLTLANAEGGGLMVTFSGPLVPPPEAGGGAPDEP